MILILCVLLFFQRTKSYCRTRPTSARLFRLKLSLLKMHSHSLLPTSTHVMMKRIYTRLLHAYTEAVNQILPSTSSSDTAVGIYCTFDRNDHFMTVSHNTDKHNEMKRKITFLPSIHTYTHIISTHYFIDLEAKAAVIRDVQMSVGVGADISHLCLFPISFSCLFF